MQKNVHGELQRVLFHVNVVRARASLSYVRRHFTFVAGLVEIWLRDHDHRPVYCMQIGINNLSEMRNFSKIIYEIKILWILLKFVICLSCNTKIKNVLNRDEHLDNLGCGGAPIFTRRAAPGPEER